MRLLRAVTGAFLVHSGQDDIFSPAVAIAAGMTIVIRMVIGAMAIADGHAAGWIRAFSTVIEGGAK